MFRICKSFEIENGHMLSMRDGGCRFPHGHSRTVEIVFAADELDDAGMVCDFTLVKRTVRDYIETFDHALCMNTCDPMFATLKTTYGERIIGFTNTEPTTEVLAKTFFDTIKEMFAHLTPRVRLERVRVWETSSSWAEFEEK